MIIGTPQRNIYPGLIASKILVAVCLVLSLVGGAWAFCQTMNPYKTSVQCSGLFSSKDACTSGNTNGPGWIIDYNNAYGRPNYVSSINSVGECKYQNPPYGWYKTCSVGITYCTTQAEQDSLVQDLTCRNNPSAPGCTPPIDSTACDSYRAECEQIGGTFTGNPVSTDDSPTGCLSHCSICNSVAINNYRRAIAASCCRIGQVPPENVTRCLDQEIAGQPDMGFSTTDCDSRGDNDCDCDYLSSDNASRYKSICIDNEFEDPNSIASSGDGSSSSGEGDSTSSGGEVPPFSPDYYPILDTIRDTTIQIKRYMGEIVDCLRYGTCEGLKRNDTTIVNVDGGGSDSAFIKKTNVKLDSIYDIIADGDTNIVKGLVALDSDLVKAIRQNPPISDSSYIKSTADSISAANDTTRKWMKRIADSLGVGTDSLIAHLDSIVKHIPDTLLDSILKYQQYAGDNFDSVLYGKGKGFSLIDSLIDSTIKYLGEGTSSLGDSIGNIGSKLDSMYNGNGSLPGDTSGSNIYDGWADGEGSDTTGNGYLMGLGSIAQAGLNDTSLDRIYGMNSSSSIGDTSIYSLPSVDSLQSALQESIEQDYKDLEDTLKNYFDTLRNEIQLINFDSAIIAPLGLKVPNTNTCPVDCFTIDLSGAGQIYSSVKGLSWPLCKSYSAMAGLNVLQFIRLILRIVTAIGCVYIGMWFIAGKK